ncbi:hypothetical protein ACJMK2_022681, partial [Sinanodonta woodiana]
MLSQRSVEDWLDANPEAMQDYFLRKADIELINRWLVKHGFQTLQDYINCGVRVSLSPNSGPSSPNDVRYGETFFNSKHNRSNSKKHLRQDYAKSKFKNIFRTYEPGTAQDVGTGPRRSSLKDMRMFRSLPPSTVNMLSLLIQSKVRLPRYPSKDIDLKREMRHRNEREFFMEIVKEIANDLDLLSLSEKMMVNVSILIDGDRSSVFVIEGKNTPKPSLISKIFDVHAGTHVLPSTSANSCVRVPWGKGIIGHVAETGEVVNLKEASL